MSNGKWNLDNLYQGYSDSEELQHFVRDLHNDIEKQINRLMNKEEKANKSLFFFYLNTMEDLKKRLEELVEFTLCLVSQNTKDEKAQQLDARASEISTRHSFMEMLFQNFLIEIHDVDFLELEKELNDDRISLYLHHLRENAKDRLPVEMENLISELAIDGYKGWAELYQLSISNLRFQFQEEQLTLGELSKYSKDNNRIIREEVHHTRQNTLRENEETFAAILNHFAGFRMKVYKQRGWDSVLKEPLILNKISQHTLNTMWDTIKSNNHIFHSYFKHKAKLLGIDKLSYFDLFVPIDQKNDGQKQYSLEEGIQFILEKTKKQFPIFSKFVEKSYQNQWIDSEIRVDKQLGGFAAAFPVSRESRVFLNYYGSFNDVAVLAHELGHTFHGTVLFDQPSLLQKYPMSLAETASTLSELIITDSENVSSKEEELEVLEEQINAAVLYLLYVQFHFFFEIEFYRLKAEGLNPTAAELTKMVVEKQREVFGDQLEHYQDYFWIVTPHFYYVEEPFYNFVYTFGFLFSNGLYEQSKSYGDDFESKYIELLKDTGILSVEELSMKHFDIDLTKPDFWQQAINRIESNIQRYMELTES
ncbi:oligoendopeptidase [Bacillus sp. CGMCC 1.16607]|uniref:oligoendopeptidase n=1 Tax=Bacillus sp. CGMCC 1.16607 TaxID=3351842 RepID=UPI00363DC5F6